MTYSEEEPIVTFTPSNEPYLGRETLHALDNIIIEALQLSNSVAPNTFNINKTEIQTAACQLIPQSINIALSVRELIRQGYLFGAYILIRPLAERISILLYLCKYPDKISLWNEGWQHGKAPSLANMIEEIGGSAFEGAGRVITQPYNSMLHGKPDSAFWSLIDIEGAGYGHTPSKMLNNPALCDEVSLTIAGWLAVVIGLTAKLFLGINSISAIPIHGQV